MQIFSPGVEEILIQLSNFQLMKLRTLSMTERHRISGLEQSLGQSTHFFYLLQREMIFVVPPSAYKSSLRDFRKAI